MFQKLFKTFRNHSKQPRIITTETALLDNGWYVPLTAKQLLSTELRQQYLTKIWQNVSMTPDMFDNLYRMPIEKYAELVQLLPASESHHHSHIGGMLDHGLEVISIAARLRQNYVLPQNAPPEEQARQRDVWTAVIIYAALLHDIGKIAVDIEVILKNGGNWLPWQGRPTQPYKFRYIKERDYGLHPVLGGVLASYLLPKTALDWITPYHQAFSHLMYFISGHFDRAGILAEIIQKADQISVTLALGGDPAKLAEKPKTSFAKQLHIALRHVVGNFKLSAVKGGSEGWLTEDALWVMSKTVADNIRGYLMSQGISAPSQNGKLFDELQAHNLIEKSGPDSVIWQARPISSAGWAPAKPFSLLKILPSIIWENIDDRPPIFDGRVVIEQAPADTENTSTLNTVTDNNQVLDADVAVLSDIPVLDEPSSQIDIINSEPDKNVESTEPVNHSVTTESMDYQEIETEPAISSLEQTETESDMDFVLNLFPDTEMIEETSEPDTDISTSEDESGHFQPMMNKSKNNVEPVKAKNAVKKSDNLSPKKPIALQPKPVNKESLDTGKPNEVISGERFVKWLKAGILSGKLIYNRQDAKLHIVNNCLFIVTPSIFQIYLGEAGIEDDASWELLQKRFQNLGIHKRKQTKDDSRNIWTCSVVGTTRKSQLSGYLLPEPKKYFGDKVLINNLWITLEGKVSK